MVNVLSSALRASQVSDHYSQCVAVPSSKTSGLCPSSQICIVVGLPMALDVVLSGKGSV